MAKRRPPDPPPLFAVFDDLPAGRHEVLPASPTASVAMAAGDAASPAFVVNVTSPAGEPVILRAPHIEPPDQAARDYAINPLHHVVLEASAGTGKTSVLVRRYLNLLEAGVSPLHILAITFTRKAAAEMRERIITHLRREAQRSPAGRARWHALRDRVGDISISTIDAFCLSLLREFPLEADLDPGFRMADDTEIARLSSQALDHALRIGRAVAQADADLATLFAHLSPMQLRNGLMHLLARRLVAPAALAAFLRGAPAARSADEVLRGCAGRLLDILDGADGRMARFLATGPVSSPRFRVLARDLSALRGGGVGVERVRAAVSRLQAYMLKADGEPRRQPHGYRAGDYPGAEARTRHLAMFAQLAPRVFDESDRLAREMNVVLARGVQRLFGIAERFYLQSLEELDVLDFSEGLRRAVEMLERMDEFSRSRFRLESRYQHLLVDEFQDTSHLQWRLVSLLIESWRAGEGIASEGAIAPTIFVVGDRKQSIYRFRDADVSILSEAGRYISALRPGQQSTRAISTSFRSRPELLAFLNDVFDEVEKAGGRSDAFRYDEQDRFPLLEGVPVPALREPALGIVVEASAVGMAQAVGDEIVRLLASRATVRDRDTGVPRSIEVGDIAILFRSRDSHREFERALEARGIPTYVYKGLGFFESDEIQDLVAVLRALAAPHDPMRVAALLRARIARVSDAGVLVLREVLGDVLAVPGAGDERLPLLGSDDKAALDRLRAAFARWLSLVDAVPPADILDGVIADTAYVHELRGPRVVQARENVKKFRALIRRIQNAGYATIGRIAMHLDRLSAGDESNAVIDAVHAVSLMTVHASKGLEFPVVILGNLARGTGTMAPAFRVIADAGHGAPAVSVGAFRFEADRDERERESEETKRLLYVAATRARDRLYLATQLDADGRIAKNPGSLAHVLPASLTAEIERLDASAASMAWTGRSGAAHVFRACRVGAAPSSIAVADVPASASASRQLVGPLADPPRVRRIGVREWVAPPVPSSAIARGVVDSRYMVTGRLVHRLFATAAGRDAAALHVEAARLLATAGYEAEDPSRVAREAVAIVEQLRSDGALAQVLASGTVSYEVPFSLRVEDAGDGTVTVVRGAIDAIVVDGARVTVVEIKTGAPAAWHHAQVAVYVRAATALFPGCEVSGVLLGPAVQM